MARDSFATFEPFINIFDCGLKDYDGPFHTIPKEAWALFRRHKAGEKDIRYQDGEEFDVYLDVIRNIYSPQQVHRHLEDKKISYYTSGRKGLGLLYLDVDAHHAWQTDEYRGRELLEDLFPFGYFRPSDRGQNGYLKIRYTSISCFNALARRLEQVLKQVFLHAGILCDVEIKGTITDNGKSGTLAKLPFRTKFPSYMRDQDDSWNYPQLEKFQSAPVVNLKRIERIADQVETLVDPEKVSRCVERKKRLEREEQRKEKRQDMIRRFRRLGAKGSDEDVWEKIIEVYRRWKEKKIRANSSSSKGVASQHANRGVEDAPVRHHLRATPVARKKSPAARRRTAHGACSGDAFIRNQQDLLPFVRSFYKRYRQFPNLDDALDHLRENGLFSGSWEDGAHRRSKRVGQILAFIEETFDPKLLGNGETQALALSRGRFRWWVRERFGNGITIKAPDIQKFDPVSMIAPVSEIFIPVHFIETFLVVVDVCLNQDPLENKAVPTNRVKKLWEMVRGGASWNQRYFQLVRDMLDRMDVIRIFDRNHERGKAWRWEAGPNFPSEDWKEKEQKRVRGIGSSGTISGDLLFHKQNTNNKVHKTLYQTDAPIWELANRNSPIRPPPG